MAIFEQQIAKKVLIDDTESISCVIETWRNVNGHTEFAIKVKRNLSPEKTWRIYKRYNDFYNLHTYLQSSGIPLQLPPKKIIGNKDPEFIAERQLGLQKYLDTILMNPILASSLPARSFIDPVNYCQPFGELALQHVSLALRGEMGWEVVSPFTEMGWRLRKNYYQICCKSLQKKEFLGSWTDYGPDKHLDDKDMHLILKSLNQIQHPYIHSIELCLCTDIGGLFVRISHKNGSLRDLICSSKPQQSFLKKYGNPKGHKPLKINQVALYGRQILEALKFLHEKGLPYGHLHSGNIIIDGDRAKLLDIENGILGVPSFYRPYFMQHKKINTLESIDVYCFGHTLYEMALGAPLHKSVIDDFSNSPPALRPVLEAILSAEACKSRLPTIESLINHQFFASVNLKSLPDDKFHLKIPISVKEHLKKVVHQIEDRLKDEQKMVRSQKRLVKVQEMMSSEEEKKKQRHKLKHEQRQLTREHHKQKSEDHNGKAHDERSDSVNSSATTSLGTATPPSMSGLSAPAPPPPPPPLANDSALKPNILAVEVNAERSALLGAICNFNKTTLRKTKVN